MYFHEPPINWLVVDLMGLDVKNTIPTFNPARRFRMSTDEMIAHTALQNIPAILEKITRASQRGFYDVLIHASDVRAPFLTPRRVRLYVLRRIEKELLRMGFRVMAVTLSDWMGCTRRSALRIWWTHHR